jgi:hypothetical protein
MIARIRRFAVAALALTSAALTAPIASAQQPAAEGSSSREAAPGRALAAGPTVDRAAVGARPLAPQQAPSDADAQAALQQRLGLGQARAMMIVGFAAVIIGLIMDNDPGTLIAIGGAVVGLYGLYNYLR